MADIDDMAARQNTMTCLKQYNAVVDSTRPKGNSPNDYWVRNTSGDFVRTNLDPVVDGGIYEAMVHRAETDPEHKLDCRGPDCEIELVHDHEDKVGLGRFTDAGIQTICAVDQAWRAKAPPVPAAVYPTNNTYRSIESYDAIQNLTVKMSPSDMEKVRADIKDGNPPNDAEMVLFNEQKAQDDMISKAIESQQLPGASCDPAEMNPVSLCGFDPARPVETRNDVKWQKGSTYDACRQKKLVTAPFTALPSSQYSFDYGLNDGYTFGKKKWAQGPKFEN